jgi:hypothetical protein
VLDNGGVTSAGAPEVIRLSGIVAKGSVGIVPSAVAVDVGGWVGALDGVRVQVVVERVRRDHSKLVLPGGGGGDGGGGGRATADD